MARTDDAAAKDRIWAIVQAINRTCATGGDFAALGPSFHERVAMAYADFTQRAEGRDACLRQYQDACAQMRFERFEAHDPQIDVYGDAAVVCYRYDCVWQFQGKKATDAGHEVQVFVNEGGDWQLAWRTVLPAERKIALVDAGADAARTGADRSLRAACRELMRSAPACYLTLIDADGFPQTTAMLNLRNPKQFPSAAKVHDEDGRDFLLYMTTGMTSPKVARARANPKACVYFCDPSGFFGLMLGGAVTFVDDPHLKRRLWENGWTMYYPSGADGPEYGILRLVPRVVKGWHPTGAFDLSPHGGEA